MPAVISMASPDIGMPTRRIPKLAVRNQTPGSDLPDYRPSTHGSSQSGDRPPSSSHSSLANSRPPFEHRESDETINSTRRSFNHAIPKSQPGKKKKNTGLLGFLTLKEPSTLAFEQFAAAEKEKARQKGGRATAVGLPGVSSQKLPQHVPKVNSKWDGLPDSASRYSSESKGTNNSHRGSSFSSSTTQTMSTRSSESRRPWGSISSRPLQSPTFTNRTSVTTWGSRPSADGPQAVSPRTSTAQPRALALAPSQLPTAVEQTEENMPQTFLYPPSPTQTRQTYFPDPPSLVTTPELEAPRTPALHELDGVRSGTSSPALNSPATPPADGSEINPALVGIHYPELASADQLSSADVNGTFWNSDTDQEEVIAKKPAPMSFRRPVNFSRPRSHKPAPLSLPTSLETARRKAFDDSGLALSPTLQNSNGRVSPFLTDTFAAESRETGVISDHTSTTAKACPLPLEPTFEEDEEESTAKHASVEKAANIPVRVPSKRSPATERLQSSARSRTSTDSANPSTTLSTAAAQPEIDRGPARSDSNASLAPSVVSERWQLSPKERLGLGSRVRKADVLPWEEADYFFDGVKVVRSEPKSVPQADGKHKRMSWRYGPKR